MIAYPESKAEPSAIVEGVGKDDTMDRHSLVFPQSESKTRSFTTTVSEDGAGRTKSSPLRRRRKTWSMVSSLLFAIDPQADRLGPHLRSETHAVAAPEESNTHQKLENVHSGFRGPPKTWTQTIADSKAGQV